MFKLKDKDGEPRIVFWTILIVGGYFMYRKVIKKEN